MTVPSSGTFKMYAEGRDDSYIDETSLTAVFFTKSGDTHTKFDCIDSSYAGYEHEISSRTAGEMVYIQLLSYNELYEYGSNFSTFKFDFCVFKSSALDIFENHTPMLSYYSNPVGNRLAVESPYQIQTLRVYDLHGKVVLHKTPNQQNLSLDTYMLAPGAYLLRVETPVGKQIVKLLKK